MCVIERREAGACWGGFFWELSPGMRRRSLARYVMDDRVCGGRLGCGLERLLTRFCGRSFGSFDLSFRPWHDSLERVIPFMGTDYGTLATCALDEKVATGG